MTTSQAPHPVRVDPLNHYPSIGTKNGLRLVQRHCGLGSRRSSICPEVRTEHNSYEYFLSINSYVYETLKHAAVGHMRKHIAYMTCHGELSTNWQMIKMSVHSYMYRNQGAVDHYKFS